MGHSYIYRYICVVSLTSCIYLCIYIYHQEFIKVIIIYKHYVYTEDGAALIKVVALGSMMGNTFCIRCPDVVFTSIHVAYKFIIVKTGHVHVYIKDGTVASGS